MEKLDAVRREGLKVDLPDFRPGDSIRVMVRVREGDKERLQAFEGVCIARRGAGGRAPVPGREVSARGRPFRHDDAVRFSVSEALTVLCGHYKDVDQRVAVREGVEELSVGEFVLSGGEFAGLCMVDAVVRLLPGALGDHESAAMDSYYDGGLLSPPSYTRPPVYRGHAVPEVLLSGDHQKVAEWRRAEAERLTRERRPDLWERYCGET